MVGFHFALRIWALEFLLSLRIDSGERKKRVLFSNGLLLLCEAF